MTDPENPYHSPLPVDFESSTNRFSPLLQIVNRSRIGFGFAVAPSVVMLALFYSLAIHMFLSLGALPTTIGERGFPSWLVFHAWIAQGLFTILLLGCFAWPVVFIVCVLIRRLQFMRRYLGAFMVSCVACAFLMSLAPSQFLYWWWD